jgi:hypothetical protein
MYLDSLGPNKATSFVWGQWDLNIAGKGVQLLQYVHTIHKGVTSFIRIEEMDIPGHYVRLHL